MSDKKTVSISSDPEFLDELSEYLEVLSNPIRLKILKFIEREPKETSEIASHIGSSYQNTKKHLDRLVTTSLVKRDAGFGGRPIAALPRSGNILLPMAGW